MQHTEYVTPGWVPRFLDYLSMSIWTSSAFSPAETSAIKPWAKALMMIEAAASLALAALVISRDQHPLASGFSHGPGPGVIVRMKRPLDLRCATHGSSLWMRSTTAASG